VHLVAPIPFQTFFAEHRDAVWRLLVATVGRQDAEDCFQETWLAALRGWPPSYDDNLRGWLFAIARSKATDANDLLQRWNATIRSRPLLTRPPCWLGGDRRYPISTGAQRGQ